MPAKKVKGRKRHLVVDTQGGLRAVVVHPADIQDRDGAKLVLQRMARLFPDLHLLWADSGYAGALETWVAEPTPWALDIVRKDPQAQGFAVLPQRWIVERTFAWLGPVAWKPPGAPPPPRLRGTAGHLRSLDLCGHDRSQVGTPDRVDLKSFRTPS